jgi:hypothetical protein
LQCQDNPDIMAKPNFEDVVIVLLCRKTNSKTSNNKGERNCLR